MDEIDDNAILGTINGTLKNGPRLVDGVIGKALHFNGNSQSAEFGLLPSVYVVIARNRSFQKLCFYTCLSFCTQRSAPLHAGIHTLSPSPRPEAGTATHPPPPRPEVGPPGSRHTLPPPREQRQVPPPDQRQIPPWEQTQQDQRQVPLGLEAGTAPVQCMLGDTGNKWAVRILLECNLVLHTSCFLTILVIYSLVILLYFLSNKQRSG